MICTTIINYRNNICLLVTSLFLSQSFVLFDQILNSGDVRDVSEGEHAKVMVVIMITYNK